MAGILIVGSVALDEVVFLNRPLTPGTHMEGKSHGARFGGGGANIGVALVTVPHQVRLLTAVGSDPLGVKLLRGLASAGMDISQVVQVSGSSTRSLIMIDADGERTIVNLTRAYEAKLPQRLLNVSTDCLYVRSRSLDLAQVLAEKARDCRIIAHMPPLEPGSRPAHILVASESDLEAKALVQPFETGRLVAGDLLEWVVITRGAQGATAFGRDGTVIEIAAPAVEVVDTTGAGDAFAAGLIHALVSGAAMADALTVACAWGAEAVRWEASALPAEAVAGLVG